MEGKVNDPHSAYITYAWFVGTGLAVIIGVIPIVYIFGRGKVNKEMCKLMHDNTDKVIGLIHTTLTSQQQLLQQSRDSLIRIETSMEKNGWIKK